MTNQNDIIQACKQGEKLARKMLYEEFSPRMRAVSFRYVGNISDAEDIIQECFITIFKKINQYTGKGSFEGWIRRIIINSSLRFLEIKNRIPIISNEINTENYDYDSETQVSFYGKEKPEDLVRKMNFSKEELMEILQLLPIGYRTVFNLYVFDKLSHNEISEVLSISESTSKTQLFKARKYLQQKLYEISLQRVAKEENKQYKEFLRVVI